MGGFPGLGGVGKAELLLNGYRVLFWCDKNVLELDRAVDCATL